MGKKIFLLSNSFMKGSTFFQHCIEDLKCFLGSNNKGMFIPYALGNWDHYFFLVRTALSKHGISIGSIHQYQDKVEILSKSDFVLVGGGNTFRLLTTLYDKGLIKAVKKRVDEGMIYVGASAGANIACPTIKTTNDMPIIFPPSFDALNLVSFNINPHYLDPDLTSMHMGETRDRRIEEFHEINDVPVVALREGSWLVINDESITLRGVTGAKIFFKSIPPRELSIDEEINLAQRNGI